MSRQSVLRRSRPHIWADFDAPAGLAVFWIPAGRYPADRQS